MSTSTQGNPVTEWVVPAGRAKQPVGENRRGSCCATAAIIDPESLEDYLAADGYKALEQALNSMSPQDVN